MHSGWCAIIIILLARLWAVSIIFIVAWNLVWTMKAMRPMQQKDKQPSYINQQRYKTKNMKIILNKFMNKNNSFKWLKTHEINRQVSCNVWLYSVKALTISQIYRYALNFTNWLKTIQKQQLLCMLFGVLFCVCHTFVAFSRTRCLMIRK